MIEKGYYTTDYQYGEVERDQRIWNVTWQNENIFHYYEWGYGSWGEQNTHKNDQQWGWATFTLKKLTEEEAKMLIIKWKLKYD